jgi:hypothetical protein
MVPLGVSSLALWVLYSLTHNPFLLLLFFLQDQDALFGVEKKAPSHPTN